MAVNNPTTNDLSGKLNSYEESLPDSIKEPDWTISELYNKSWTIVKNNPILWIFGMAAGGAAGGSNWSNFSRISDGFNTATPTPTPETNQIDQVLGAASSASSSFAHLFSNIPPFFWLLLAIEGIALAVLLWGIAIIYSVWSNASLINAVNIALGGKSPSIRESSEKSFGHLGQVAWLSIVPILVLTFGGILVIGALAGGFAASPVIGKVIFGILFAIAALAFLYFLIYLILSEIWALRMVVLEGKDAKSSLMAGYKIAKKKKWAMAGLGFVNGISATFAILAPIIVIGLVFFVGWLLFAHSAVAPLMLAVGILLGIAAIVGLMVFGGAITAFRASVWTIAYNKIKGKYDQ